VKGNHQNPYLQRAYAKEPESVELVILEVLPDASSAETSTGLD
jgi:hypothetical protein